MDNIQRQYSYLYSNATCKITILFKSKGHVTNCHCFVLIFSFVHFVFSSETPLNYLIVSKPRQVCYVPRINDAIPQSMEWKKILLHENQLYWNWTVPERLLNDQFGNSLIYIALKLEAYNMAELALTSYVTILNYKSFKSIVW